MDLLLGMLGLSGMRTLEKRWGAATNAAAMVRRK